MSLTHTNAFREKNIDYLVITFVIGIVLLILLAFLSKEIYKDKAVLFLNEEYDSPPIDFKRTAFLPAYKIKITAQIPVNHWLDYEVMLVEGDEDIFGFEQNVWREKGIWREGGESGRWHESDRKKEFMFVPHKSGKYHLHFAIASLTGVRGQKTRKSDAIILFYSVIKNYASYGTILASLLVLLIGLMLVVTFTWTSKTAVYEKNVGTEKLIKGANYFLDVPDANRLIMICLEINRDLSVKSRFNYSDVFRIRIVAPNGKETVIKDSTKPLEEKYRDEDEDPIRVYSTHSYYYMPTETGKYQVILKLDGKQDFYSGGKLKVFYVEKTLTSVPVYR